MLMTFVSDKFDYYGVLRIGIQNTGACQPQCSLQTSKCIHRPCEKGELKKKQKIKSVHFNTMQFYIAGCFFFFKKNYYFVSFILHKQKEKKPLSSLKFVKFKNTDFKCNDLQS